MKKLNLVGLGTAGKRSYFVLEKKNIFSRYFNEILEKLGIEERVYDKEYDSVLESIEEKNNEIEHFKNEYFRDKEFNELSAKPDFSKCIELINKDCGYAVLAHPAYQFKKDISEIFKHENEYKAKLILAKQIGLWGIEMHSYESIDEADALNKIFHSFAIDCGLNITYGSDFHGENDRNTRRLGCLNKNFDGFKR